MCVLAGTKIPVWERFQNWIKSNYDMTNPKIQEKHEHTASVLAVATAIAEKENLSEEDRFIAQVTAILHDCARFEQIKVYDTFKDSPEFDHAKEGAKMLENGLLKEMLPEIRRFDDIIITAVKCHSLLTVPEFEPRTAMHCDIIRDADRTDLYNVCIKSFDVLFWFESDIHDISPKVKELFESRQPIPFSELKSNLDLLTLRFGLITQYKFTSALAYIKEQNYINRIADLFIEKLPLYNKDDVNWVRKTALAFLE